MSSPLLIAVFLTLLSTSLGLTPTPSTSLSHDSINFFKVSTIKLDWSGDLIGSNCYCRLRASAESVSASPGSYSSWYEGKVGDKDDNSLEEYGHHWQSCSSTVTYSSKADGYYMFTASCASGDVDYAFKIDTVAPSSVLTASSSYDPAPSTQSSYSFGIILADTHGTVSSVDVTASGEKDRLSYKWAVDNGAWTTVLLGPSGYLTLGSYGAGPHCLEVKGIDYSGNIETISSQYCWTVETFTRTTGCTFSYSLNSAEYQTTSSTSVVMKELPDGTNSFSIKAMDMYGNPTIDSRLNTFTWTVDTIKPVASFTSGGTWEESELVTSTKGSFSYQSSESGSFFKYQVDGGAVVTAPTATTQSFSSGTFAVKSCSGTTHTFNVYAVDPVGNVGDSAMSSFTVDPINTALALTNSASDSVVSSPTAVFSISAVVDNSAPSSFSYEYKVDGGSWQKGKHFPSFGVRGLSDGEHTIKARASTNGGCTDPTPYSLTFTVDTTAPITTLHCPISPYNQETIIVHGMVEDATVKSTGTQYRLGTSAYSTPGNPVVNRDNTFSVAVSSLIEGAYTIYVKSTDIAGLTGEEASCTWVVDFGPPDTMVVAGPAARQHVSESSNFSFSCTESSCTYAYSINGGEYINVEDETAAVSGLPEGVHTLRVYATDAASNSDPTPAAYTWTVYEEEMYAEYCAACSFRYVESTPLDYKPMDSNHVHDVVNVQHEQEAK